MLNFSCVVLMALKYETAHVCPTYGHNFGIGNIYDRPKLPM